MYPEIDQTKTLPHVGMPATYTIGTDSYAGEIILASPSGAYVIFRDTHGVADRFNRGRDGRYRGKGRIGVLTLGVAREYRDPSF